MLMLLTDAEIMAVDPLCERVETTCKMCREIIFPKEPCCFGIARAQRRKDAQAGLALRSWTSTVTGASHVLIPGDQWERIKKLAGGEE